MGGLGLPCPNRFWGILLTPHPHRHRKETRMTDHTSPGDLIVILSNTDSAESAARMARELVGKQLVACVNVVPGVRSFYRWKGKIAEDDEHLMVIKTRRSLFEQVRACMRELHPYELPEIIALPIQEGDPDYLTWVRECTAEIKS